FWYIVHDGETPGRAYGIGVPATARTVIGYFGKRGFGEAIPPREQWFEISGYSELQSLSTLRFEGREPRWSSGTPRPLLLADGQLWKIDFIKRQVTSLVESPQGYHFGQAWRILENPPVPSADSEDHWASSFTPLDALVREPEHLLIVNPHSGESKRYPLPA